MQKHFSRNDKCIRQFLLEWTCSFTCSVKCTNVLPPPHTNQKNLTKTPTPPITNPLFPLCLKMLIILLKIFCMGTFSSFFGVHYTYECMYICIWEEHILQVVCPYGKKVIICRWVSCIKLKHNNKCIHFYIFPWWIKDKL